MKSLRLEPIITSLICLTALSLFTGCPTGERSPIGFRLPEGDVAQGKTAFVELGCIQCHLIDGDSPMPEPIKPREIYVVLGGEITRVKTYGQLVTSIINPSHVIDRKYRATYTNADGSSKMPDFTKKMTVRQMIDITEFLQAQYEIKIPDPMYSEYGYGP